MFENFGPAIPCGSSARRSSRTGSSPAGAPHRVPAATEPEARSDLGAIRTYAVDKGGSYLINGEKCFHPTERGQLLRPGGLGGARVGAVGLRLFMVDALESPGVSGDPGREKRACGVRRWPPCRSKR